MSLRIGVDVDQVVADLMPAWLDRYNLIYDDHLTPAQITEWDIQRFVHPSCGDKIFGMLTPDIYREVKPIVGAFQACEALRRIGNIFFVTDCRGSLALANAKFQWLVDHGFLQPDEGFRFIATDGSKKDALVDVLIDDKPQHVNAFPGWALLVQQPHNQTSHTYRIRINHLGEALSLLRGLRSPCGCASRST